MSTSKTGQREVAARDVDEARGGWSRGRMANVLSDEKKQQVLALGRLGWSLRRIEEATGVRRETASAYLKAAGIAVRSPGAGADGRRQNRPER